MRIQIQPKNLIRIHAVPKTVHVSNAGHAAISHFWLQPDSASNEYTKCV